MAAFFADYCLDALLAKIQEATHLVLCSQAPTTYAEANTTYKLGTKASPTIGSPADASPDGRGVTVSAISDGTVDANGTATHVALIDTGNSRLLAHQALSASKALVTGSPFTLTSFVVRQPDGA